MSCSANCGCGTATCCAGNDVLVPEAKDNAPGQPALRYRVGTYATFLPTMLARLVHPPPRPPACDPAADEPDPFGFDEDGRLRWPLRDLTTRETDDPTIALLDAWAVVGDVLTFYQERIANEGYLRTATEQRSVEELARLVGYRPRPGVAAAVDLAFTLDVGQSAEVPAGTRAQSLPQPGKQPQVYETSEPLVAAADWNALQPLLTRFQGPRSVRGKLELHLDGLATNLKLNDVVLVDPPDRLRSVEDLFRVELVEPRSSARSTRVLLRPYAGGTVTIEDTDLDHDPGPEEVDAEVRGVVRTFLEQSSSKRSRDKADDDDGQQQSFADGRRLRNDREILEIVGGDRALRENLRKALEELKASRTGQSQVHVFRASSPLFGFNATDGILGPGGQFQPWPEPGDERDDRLFLDLADERVRPNNLMVIDPGPLVPVEFRDLANGAGKAVGEAFDALGAIATLQKLLPGSAAINAAQAAAVVAANAANAASERARAAATLDVLKGQLRAVVAAVDAAGDAASAAAKSGGGGDAGEIPNAREAAAGAASAAKSAAAALQTELDALSANTELLPQLTLATVKEAKIHARFAYGIAKTTLELRVADDWIHWRPVTEDDENIADLAPLRSVMTHIEPELLPLARAPMGPLRKGRAVIELAGLHFDLEPGRTLIVEGDDDLAPGARRSERVTIASVDHDLVEVSTRVTLTEGLRRSYVRVGAVIHGNVAPATQGESRSEVLGSGDASRPSQEFTLRHRPLTHVPADTVDGVASTLTARVGGVAWPEAELFAALGPRDRAVVTRLDDQGRTVVVGGDGWHGARFPTGVENITAEYRSGQGADGNVDPGKITNLATRPFGVQKVINPGAASGGADPDGVEDTRLRAPLAATSLDRLLSVKDHEDFALRFAGVAKARAQLIGGKDVRARWRVRTVVAGALPLPLPPDALLLARLRQAMRRFGDPALELEVVPAALERVSVTAKIAVAPGFAFRDVQARVRAALGEQLGYAAQRIGQAIVPSRVVAIVQGVAGVALVDLDAIARNVDDDTAIESDLDPLDVADTNDPERGKDDARVTRPEPDAVLFVDPARPETLTITEQKL